MIFFGFLNLYLETMSNIQKISVLFTLLSVVFLSACSHSVQKKPDMEGKVEIDIGGGEEILLEENMDTAEYVYKGEPELVNPTELFATFEKGVLTPDEFYAKKGDYVLLNITNKTKEEHALIIPQHGWHAILHKNEETEFGFRAREKGIVAFHCSVYCKERGNHMRGTIFVE